MALELRLVEPGVVQGPEARGQPAQCADQLQLREDPVDDETEMGLLRKVDSGLGLALHLVERIAAGEQVREKMLAAEDGEGEITGLLRRVEGAAHERAAGAHMMRPGIHVAAEVHVHARVEAIEAAPLHQV
jgi:hypothetical protein